MRALVRVLARASTRTTAVRPGAELVAWLLVLPAVSFIATTAFPAELRVQLPQPGFGYTIGDRLHQRILTTEPIDAQSLPPLGRVTPWLQRIAVTPVRGADGEAGLELVYQVINAPPAITRVALPGVTLALRDGEQRETVPASVIIGPLLPAGTAIEPRPDRQPPPPSTRGIERVRDAALLVLGLCVLAVPSWWFARSRRDAGRLPFSRAWRTVRGTSNDDAGAWSSVHRAFNECAGGTVHAGNLAALRTARSWLEPHAAALEAFFAASDARFFATGAGAGSVAPGFDLAGFARTLMRAERRAAR